MPTGPTDETTCTGGLEAKTPHPYCGDEGSSPSRCSEFFDNSVSNLSAHAGTDRRLVGGSLSPCHGGSAGSTPAGRSREGVHFRTRESLALARASGAGDRWFKSSRPDCGFAAESRRATEGQANW